MRKPLAVLCVLSGAVMLASCKSVDVEETKAQLVPGTSNLYRFCDEANLIYFSKWESDADEYEYFISGGCGNPAATPAASTAPSTVGGGR